MPQESRRCDRCGTRVAPAARFCSHCGARVADQPAGPTLMRVIWSLGLAFAALSLGRLGTCFLISGVGMLGGEGSALVMAIPLLLIALSAFVGLIKLLR